MGHIAKKYADLADALNKQVSLTRQERRERWSRLQNDFYRELANEYIPTTIKNWPETAERLRQIVQDQDESFASSEDAYAELCELLSIATR